MISSGGSEFRKPKSFATMSRKKGKASQEQLVVMNPPPFNRFAKDTRVLHWKDSMGLQAGDPKSRKHKLKGHNSSVFSQNAGQPLNSNIVIGRRNLTLMSGEMHGRNVQNHLNQHISTIGSVGDGRKNSRSKNYRDHHGQNGSLNRNPSEAGSLGKQKGRNAFGGKRGFSLSKTLDGRPITQIQDSDARYSIKKGSIGGKSISSITSNNNQAVSIKLRKSE